MNNMTIAKLHKASRKFVGWITAAGPFIAYLLSMMTIIAGVVIYAAKIWPNNGFYLTGAGLIGIFFALLVERLTLTQAAKVRTINEKSEDIKNRYALVEDRTAATEANQERELDLAEKGRGGAWTLMLAGALVSTCAGTLFWHYLLQALPTYQSWGFSTLFSAIVSFTLVASELHRHLDNEVIASSIMADHFTNMAAREDARDRVIDGFNDKHEQALQEALDHNTVNEIADYTAQQTLDGIFDGQGQIPMHIQRERASRQDAAERERERTAEQMKIVRSAKPKDEKPKGLFGRIGDAFKPAIDEHSSNGKEPSNFR